MVRRQNDVRKTFVRFFTTAGLVAFVVLLVYLAWSLNVKQGESVRRALAEARTLNIEINAAWDYIGSIQDIPSDQAGEMALPNVYCALAAKNMAERFSDQSDYHIRYVRVDPRNKNDSPDAFELQALESFASSDETECYSVEQEGQSMVFRYVSELKIERGCLPCHGDPAGGKDVTGYLKEGMAEGDTAGAVSIVMPMDASVAEARSDLVSTTAFFCSLMVAVGIVLALALRRWITRPILAENERIAHESEEQSKLLAVVSHELKTPLSSIIAFAELWRMEQTGHDAQGAEMAGEVESNGRVLLDMVNNLLDAAKLESGGISLACEEVDVGDVASLVHTTMQPLAAQKGIALRVHVEPDVPIAEGDADVLRRMALNLVSNALRFTEAGGRVDLRISYDGGAMVIEVEDDGRGIASDQLPLIFERFSNTSGSERTSEGGTGLGLFIVKSFADMAGGSVDVRSEVGRGSVFTVRVPMRALPDDWEGSEES